MSSIVLVGQSTANINTPAQVLSFSLGDGAYVMERDGANDGSGSSSAMLGSSTSCLGYDKFGNSLYWNGVLAELIGYGRVLSETERGAVTGYLRGKYGF